MCVEVLKAGGRRDQVTGNRCSCPDDVDLNGIFYEWRWVGPR